jgi:glycosyltransferase involved in cell wall biosynthesis
MAIDSVMLDTSLTANCMVQDASSTDETLEVLSAKRARYGDAIRWASEPDNGQSDALNKALAEADGRWVAWLNADEFYLPSGLDALVREGDRTGADVVFGDAIFVDETGRLLRLKPQHRFSRFVLKHYGPYISSCAVIFRRSILWPDPWDVHLKLVMDHDIYMKLAYRSARFRYVARPIAAFRVHEERASADRTGYAADYAIVHARYGPVTPISKTVSLGLHGAYKLTSGAYRRQRCAEALIGRPMTWTSDPSAQGHVQELLNRCYGR